ncbi:MAG: ferric reductase-like transmembrane domain-containing protein [Candidatus Gracilibacteria bacterium]|jgi:DMSO/TMAO reductase YedYZ heme-binding membrane subunit
MKMRRVITGIIGILFGIAYIIFSSAIQNTEYIWILTRIFGMVSILSLFIVVFLGELRLLGVNKFFKYHHFLGITTFYLVFLHFVSAIFEKYQWGKNLSFVDYLGTNFSDKWMIFLSIGSIAFYLMILIAVTSAYPVMAKIGYKKWRLTHYLTYLTLLFAFAHSIILGTEFNHSDFKIFFFGLTAFVFSVLIMLFVLRTGKIKLNNRVAGFLVMILMISGGMAYASTKLKLYSDDVGLLSQQSKSLTLQVEDVEYLTGLISEQQARINEFRKMAANISAMIVKARASASITTPEIAAPEPVPVPQIVPEPEELDQIINNNNNNEDDDRYEQEYDDDEYEYDDD